jgi:hypothetical protein
MSSDALAGRQVVIDDMSIDYAGILTWKWSMSGIMTNPPSLLFQMYFHCALSRNQVFALTQV